VTKWIYVMYSFKYPLWMTGTHMLASYVMASTVCFLIFVFALYIISHLEGPAYYYKGL